MHNAEPVLDVLPFRELGECRVSGEIQDTGCEVLMFSSYERLGISRYTLEAAAHLIHHILSLEPVI